MCVCFLAEKKAPSACFLSVVEAFYIWARKVRRHRVTLASVKKWKERTDVKALTYS